jgi:hypothetical protein
MWQSGNPPFLSFATQLLSLPLLLPKSGLDLTECAGPIMAALAEEDYR